MIPSVLHKLLAKAVVLASLTCLPLAAAELKFDGEKIDTWQGHRRHVFTVAGKQAWVVEPKNPLPGELWTWVTEFPDAFTPRTGVPKLLEQGIYHAHISDYNRLGNPDQLKVMDEFYKLMQEKGFAKKPVLIGLSRGCFMAYRWASENPTKVAGIYADAGVCDLKSWPGGFGKGRGSKIDWESAKELYGWKNDEEGKAWAGNATDDKLLATLAKANVPLLHVVADGDQVVPPAENTAIVEAKYKKLGGKITVLHHQGDPKFNGHHPHGLDNPQPAVDFVVQSLKAANR
ncbi:MAG: alpha/beta hydrolase [Verrucomicrobiota bacterium]